MSGFIRWCVPYGVCVAIYLACAQLFFYASAHEGLVSPNGVPHFGVLALGVLALGARVCALFVVPFVLVYKLLGRAEVRHFTPSPTPVASSKQ